MFTWYPAPIGPPVAVAFSANSANVSGSNFPALSPAGLASPFSHSIASSSMPQILAALCFNCLITILADSVTTIAEANNTLLPPVRLLYPIVAVSPIKTDTLS